ncbi:MAG: M20/M25/M40 family metallo-hydrolase [Pseudomonadales bacterium]
MLNLRINRRTLAYVLATLVLSWATVIAASPSDADTSKYKLTADEQAIVNWVDTNTAGLEALIEAQVNINSGTMNPSGVNAVADVLSEELASLGFATERIRLPEAMQRGDHLFARRGVDPKAEGKRLLLIGHLDTIFEPGDSFNSYTRKGDWASGPGISDMKAGNAIIVYALKALAFVNGLDGGQFVVAYTGDEESPGEPLAETRKPLIDAGKWADVSLGFESGIRDEQGEWATVSRRSSSDWCLKVKGRQAHSSGIFSEEAGAGAVFEASRILNGFYDEVRGEQYLTFNAGTIMGGTEVQGDCQASTGTVFGKTNVIPRTVIVRGGLRTISNEQLARARSAMQAVLEKSLPGTDASIEFYEGYPAMAPSAGNKKLQGMLSEINMALGRQPMLTLDPSRRGAADISFVAPHSDGLAGMGGYGEGEHSPKEQLDLRSLPIATKRAAILLHRLTR